MTDERNVLPETKAGRPETNIADIKQDVRNINERIVNVSADTAVLNAKIDSLGQLLQSELGGVAKLLESKMDSLDKNVNAKIDGVKSNKIIIIGLLIALLTAMAPVYFPTIKELIVQMRTPVEVHSSPAPLPPAERRPLVGH